VGVLYGLFGVGASFATPALSFLGIPPLAAVVSPLPGFLPSSMAGALAYARRGKVDWSLAGRVTAGALPAAIVGAATSHLVPGRALLALQALTLIVIGTRILWPTRHPAVAPTTAPMPVPVRTRGALPPATVPVAVRGGGGVGPAGVPVAVRGGGGVGPAGVPVAVAGRTGSVAGWALVGGAVVVGFLSGLLANGGGFLLVPWFLMILGLDMHRATGTSLLVAASLTVPTIAVHAFVGDVDWWIAAPFALGVVPGAAMGAWLAQRLPTSRLRLAFGLLLLAIGLYYLPTQLLS